jgi:lysophospholipase L1-like esterase
MLRLLVTNGCSMTRGAELADPATQAWPALLAKNLGIPHVNLARDGSSNRRIVRTTAARLHRVTSDASVAPDEVLVLVLWTDTGRHEFYKLGPQHTAPENDAVDEGWEDIGPWRQSQRHRPSCAYYDHLWSNDGQIANLYLDWLLLDRYFQYAGYRARYAFAGPACPPVSGPGRWFASQLPLFATFGDLPTKAGMTFSDIARGHPVGPGGHPLAEGHQLFATALARWLRP